MAMIDFKTATIDELSTHMASNGLGLLDPTQVPCNNDTGLFAVMPIVIYISGNKSSTTAARTINAISELPNYKPRLFKTKFNHGGQMREMWGATLDTIVELILSELHPSERVKKFRRTCAKYVVRVLAGDTTLITEIEKQDKALSQTQVGRDFQTAVLGKRTRDDDMDRAGIERIKAETEYLRMQTELLRMQLQGGIKRTGTWSEAFATYEPEEAQPFKLAYKGLGEGVQFNCFIAGCNNTFTNSRSYHQHIFRDHKNIPEGEKPHPDWPRSAFVIHKDEQKKTEADYFDRMSRFDPATKRWRMQCTNTEYWIEDIGHRLADTGEVCGQWFDSFSAYKNHQAERHARPKDFGKGLSRKYRCPKGCPGVFDTKAEEKAHWDACHTNGVCLHCGKRFKSRASLTKHQRSCLK